LYYHQILQQSGAVKVLKESQPQPSLMLKLGGLKQLISTISKTRSEIHRFQGQKLLF
jgi:hypothetical protein